MTKTREELAKMRIARHSLPYPGPKVVEELLNEIEAYRIFLGESIISDPESHARRREMLGIPDDMFVSEFVRNGSSKSGTSPHVRKTRWSHLRSSDV